MHSYSRPTNHTASCHRSAFTSRIVSPTSRSAPRARCEPVEIARAKTPVRSHPSAGFHRARARARTRADASPRDARARDGRRGRARVAPCVRTADDRTCRPRARAGVTRARWRRRARASVSYWRRARAMCVASGGGRTRVDASAHGPVDDGTGGGGIWGCVVYSTTRTARMTGRVGTEYGCMSCTVPHGRRG